MHASNYVVELHKEKIKKLFAVKDGKHVIAYQIIELVVELKPHCLSRIIIPE